MTGTGAAAIVPRALATDVIAPVIDDAMRLSLGEEWGIDDDGGGAGDDDAREREIRIALARTAVGVAGLVTFLIATSPIEEVERVTKR